MRRIAAACLALAATVVLLGIAGVGGADDAYEIRAAFDNGAFLVPGEEVRIAGARVGTVADVEVSGATERVHEDGSAEPGKAIVVMRIDDPGFQDFRADASCLIRPQSLIGEKFVECEPTQPRAAGAPLPPPLDEVPDGEPGEGQLFLALEQNGKAVDLDLVNNIMEEPYPDRFRLILNDLGAGLAARGEDLAEIVERSNPALERTNEVLAILARQHRQLANLASDGDRVLAPLARDREALSGFVNEAGVVAAASAERSAELEAGLERLPGALRELRPTMVELRRSADQMTPVLADLGAAAPSLVRASEALGPFSDSATGALTSLGDAAERAQRPLVSSRPVVRQLGAVGRANASASKRLGRVLESLRRTNGFDYLTRLIFNAGGSINAFDSYGHFTRAVLPNNNCVDYIVIPGLAGASCDANFTRVAARAAPAVAVSAADEDERAGSAVAPGKRKLGGRGPGRGQRSDESSSTREPDPEAVEDLLGYLFGGGDDAEEPR